MISRVIGGFIAILVGASIIGPISDEISVATSSSSSMQNTSSWSTIVLKVVPGIFALAILGLGVAIIYGSLSEIEIL